MVRKRGYPGHTNVEQRPYERKRQKVVDKREMGVSDEESWGGYRKSRSATASRKMNESLKSGQFVVDKQKRENFEGKCRQMDGGVKF